MVTDSQSYAVRFPESGGRSTYHNQILFNSQTRYLQQNGFCHGICKSRSHCRCGYQYIDLLRENHSASWQRRNKLYMVSRYLLGLSGQSRSDGYQTHNTTTYQLTVTDNNNCSSIQPARITVTVTAPAKVFAGNDTSVLKNQSLQLNALDVNNSGFDSYIWSPSAGLNNS